MMRKLKLRQLERSLEEPGLPERMLARLRGGRNDEVVAMETDRGVLLSRSDPEVEEFLEDFDAIRKEYREALRKLAE